MLQAVVLNEQTLGEAQGRTTLLAHRVYILEEQCRLLQGEREQLQTALRNLKDSFRRRVATLEANALEQLDLQVRVRGVLQNATERVVDEMMRVDDELQRRTEEEEEEETAASVRKKCTTPPNPEEHSGVGVCASCVALQELIDEALNEVGENQKQLALVKRQLANCETRLKRERESAAAKEKEGAVRNKTYLARRSVVQPPAPTQSPELLTLKVDLKLRDERIRVLEKELVAVRSQALELQAQLVANNSELREMTARAQDRENQIRTESEGSLTRLQNQLEVERRNRADAEAQLGLEAEARISALHLEIQRQLAEGKRAEEQKLVAIRLEEETTIRRLLDGEEGKLAAARREATVEYNAKIEALEMKLVAATNGLAESQAALTAERQRAASHSDVDALSVLLREELEAEKRQRLEVKTEGEAKLALLAKELEAERTLLASEKKQRAEVLSKLTVLQKDVEGANRQSLTDAAKTDSKVSSLQRELDEARQGRDVAEKRCSVLQSTAQAMQASRAELLERLKQATETVPPPLLPLPPQPQPVGDDVLLEGIESTRRALESELRELRASSPSVLGVELDEKVEIEQLVTKHSEEINRLRAAATEELGGLRTELQTAEAKLVELQQHKLSLEQQTKRLQQQVESLEFERDSYMAGIDEKDQEAQAERDELEAQHNEEIKRLGGAASEELAAVRANLQASEAKLVELQQQRQQEVSASQSLAQQIKRLQQQVESLEFERDSYKTELLRVFEAEQAAVAQRGGRVATTASPAKSASIVNNFVEANRELQAQCTDLLDKVRVLSEAAAAQSEEKRLWTLQLDQEKAHAQQFFAALQAAQLAMGAQDQDFLTLQEQHTTLEEECRNLRERLRIYAPR